MVTRSQKVRLGIFVTVCVAALILTIVLILAPKLFEVRDVYYIGFRNISLTGLQKGGPVKYHGLTVGSVTDIRIDPEDISRVIVEVSLDHGTPIKADTRADIELLGITGIKVIELRSGSTEAPNLKPGDFIQPGTSITDVITGQAEVLLEKMEIILNNLIALTSDENRQRFSKLLESTAGSVAAIQRILKENGPALDQSIRNSAILTEDLKQMVVDGRLITRRLATLTASDTVGRILADIAGITESLRQAELHQLVQRINETLAHTTLVLEELDATLSRNRADLGLAVESLRESADYLNQFSRMITEDPSLLVRGTQPPKDAPDFKLKR